MTLGERINKKRKELGLSQEALANELNVSRQTVYKWENDQAIPELSKLITMAKVFNVKLGWLINEEADEVKEDVYKEVSDNLKDMIDSKNNKEIKKYKRLFIICFVFFLLIIGLFYFKISKLEDNYHKLENSLNNYSNSLRQDINNITYNIQNTLDDYYKDILDSSVEIIDYDIKTNKVSFKINISPKTYNDDMEVFIHIKSDLKEEKLKATKMDDKSFELIYDTFLANDYDFKAEIISDNTSEFILLESYYNLGASTFDTFDFIPLVHSLNVEENQIDEEYISVISNTFLWDSYLTPFIQDKPLIESYEMYLYENDKLIATYEYDEKYTIEHNEKYNSNEIFFKRPLPIKIDMNNKYEEILIITDEYGRKLEVIQGEDYIDYKYYFE